MKAGWFLIALTVVAFAPACADSPTSAERDKALKGIEACLRRNEVSSRECKNLNKDIETLENVYRQGDKTVLPPLLQFSYLGDFFGEALISDPDGFLTAVSQLSQPNQRAIAAGIAGGGGSFGLARSRFDAIRATLKQVTDSSPNYQLARRCLRTLETENAALLVDYFPPQTFTGRAGEFEVHWFSRELYALEEKPLWQSAPEDEHIYRITVLPAFSGPESVTLAVLPDGTGQIRFRTVDPRTNRLSIDKSRAINPQQAADFTAKLSRIEFWQLQTEPPKGQIGCDGAEWILEGVEDGRYHIVLRWCPGKTPFGEAARKLFELSGHRSSGGC
jgi:hypothetical protein